jgi:DNA-binding SARP family transcriptional activator
MASRGGLRGRTDLTVEFRILGTLDLIDGERSIEFPRAKPRALLAMLIIHANQVVSADRLVDALWGDLQPPSATNTLQGYVSQLRQALGPLGLGCDDGPLIRTQAPGYVLTVDPDLIDAQRFERLLADGRRALAAAHPQRAASLFGEALSLWRGPALADLAGEAFASLEAARLDELRLAAFEDQAEAELALGHHAELVGRLQALVAAHPLRERLWGQLMVALYRGGRQAEALRAFQTARHVLADELGIDPGPDLRQLEADILAQASSLRWQPQVGSGDPGDNNGRLRPALAAGAGTDSAKERIPFPRLLSVGTVVDYVGREELLSALAVARQQAFDGMCQAVLLAGEPGVGKTRTAAEVARAAFSDGAVVLYGHCDEDVAVPYQPFVEALDWYTTHSVAPVLGSFPAELSRLQPLLASRVAGLGTPVSSDPRSEEYLLFEATSSWLIELARRQPVVLILDDLHWASKPVLLLLRHVLRAAAADVAAVPMLVLGTYRDTEVDDDHPLTALLADLRRLATVDRMSVVGLSPGEVEQFVSRAAGHELEDDPSRLARALYADTEGNPFFLHEVLRHLTETGAVRGRVSGGRPGALGTMDVPEGVRDVVAGRVRRLAEPARRLLSVAAIVGADFDVELLAALSDLPESDLLDGLEQSRRARMIEETGADHYRFAHALVRATLVEGSSATRRRRLHRRIGEVIEKYRPHDVVALAHHFTEAGPDGRDGSRAVRYSLASAEQALGARALADAEGRFQAVLSLLGDSEDDLEAPQRVSAMCGLGEAQRDQGNPEYRTILLEAARLAQQCGDVALLTRAVLSNSPELPSVIGGIDVDRVAVTETALAAVGPEPGPERALLLAQLAAEISFTRDDRRRLALSDEAEAMARQMEDPGLLARVLNRTGYAAFTASRIDALVNRGEEATRLSDLVGDPAQRVLARYFWSGALLSSGDIPAFRRVTKEMPAVAEQAAPTFQWLALACQARLFQIDGDVAAARRTNDEAFQRAQEIGEVNGAAWWTATDTALAWCQGRVTGTVEALRIGMDLYPTEPAWSIGYAMWSAMGGRSDEARAVLDADPPDPQELVDHVFPFLNVLMCGVIAWHVEDTQLAERVVTALGQYSRCWSHHYAGIIGPVALPLALCAAELGDVDEGIALCEEIETLLTDFRCEGLLPRYRSSYAAILLRRGSDDSRLRAASLLREARRGAEKIDAPDLIAVIDRLTAAFGRTALQTTTPASVD